MVTALDAGEVMALTDMQQEWGSQLGWTGSPTCNWNGLRCDSNGHVDQLYVYIIIREFLPLTFQISQTQSSRTNTPLL